MDSELNNSNNKNNDITSLISNEFWEELKQGSFFKDRG